MKHPASLRRRVAGFTLVEAMVTLTIVGMALAMMMSTFVFAMRTMYKDNQRLATNESMRKFMAQIGKETIDSSYFYLFDYYTKLDGSVSLATDAAALSQNEDYTDPAYDRWVAHGDCLVLVTMTPTNPAKIRQIRIYYRRVTNQAGRNADAPLRYYATQEWPNGHPTSGMTVEALLNTINLSSATTGSNYTADGQRYNPAAGDLTGSILVALRTRGRRVAANSSPFVAGDNYPIFSTESPTQSSTNGFVSINAEFLTGTTVANQLSSSSFNYTISPRR